ncbi:MAG: sigma-70 family RNA polymerase sigma factor [Treponema sp.]|nr:sigma-70 family RNA polymerase sigma factor [Treponema sp.]
MSTINSSVTLAANAGDSAKSFNGFSTKEEFMDLLNKSKAGDIKARNAILDANMGILYNIAYSINIKTATKEELVHEGVIAFLERINEFDPSICPYLSSFMWQTVKHAMIMGNNNGMSNEDFNFINTVNKARIELADENNNAPGDEELAKITGYRLKTYRRKCNELSIYNPISLNMKVGDEDSDFTFQDLEAAKSPVIYEPDYALLRESECQGIKSAWDKLSMEDRKILGERYNSPDGKVVSFRSMAKKFNICHETLRVREAEAKEHFAKLLDDYGIQVAA